MENKINYHGDSGDFIIISSIILANCARAIYVKRAPYGAINKDIVRTLVFSEWQRLHPAGCDSSKSCHWP